MISVIAGIGAGCITAIRGLTSSAWCGPEDLGLHHRLRSFDRLALTHIQGQAVWRQRSINALDAKRTSMPGQPSPAQPGPVDVAATWARSQHPARFISRPTASDSASRLVERLGDDHGGRHNRKPNTGDGSARTAPAASPTHGDPAAEDTTPTSTIKPR
jgi:hypothetical protein